MTSFVTKIRMQFVILTTKEIKLAVENVTYIIHTIFLRSTTTANAYIRKKTSLLKLGFLCNTIWFTTYFAALFKKGFYSRTFFQILWKTPQKTYFRVKLSV